MLNQAIHKLQQALKPIDSLQLINKELENIQKGLYQHQLYTFTYHLSPDSHKSTRLNKNCLIKEIDYNQNKARYRVYPLMDQYGLRCTAAIPISIPSGPIELQINFFGTIDFAAEIADMEKEGPGQETLKKHEIKLLEQINSMIEQLNAIHPNKTFRLRLAGHSLGGALAKGFAHSLQRACAVQKNTPSTIIKNIKEELGKEIQINNSILPKVLQSLEKKLVVDKDKFKKFKALNKIEGITVYAAGAPGLGKTTDQHASLLTYNHQPDFLRVYNHFHREDIIPKFGTTEFLSGKNGITPRITTNKVIQYDIEITDEEIKKSLPGAFPGMTSRVMAAHNKLIYNSNQPIQSTIFEFKEFDYLLEKFPFSIYKRALYDALFLFKRFLASFETMTKLIPSLKSWPEEVIAKPAI
ncbi:MAG: hypothetical protein QM652_12225 [Legionella sp.]|uniref:hypothetical protein n=1 Tax=Legionella sp. TaxID=459 RepID=UPI0039E4C78A